MDDIKTRLYEISQLKDNWNGYGAKPIPVTVIDKAWDIYRLMNFEYEPIVTPTGRESIQFEWDSDKTGYVEFEVYEDKVTVYGSLNILEIQ